MDNKTPPFSGFRGRGLLFIGHKIIHTSIATQLEKEYLMCAGPSFGLLGPTLSNTKRHNVFVSYHHRNDQQYRDYFENLFARHHDIMISKSVQIGDIDPNLKTDTIRQIIRDRHLRTSSVTVVLIGSETWKRKHIDWEIAASIRETQYNSRSGLLGILLPTYPRNNPNKYYHKTIPPRLYDNINCGFATIHNWTEDPNTISSWIHEAFKRRTQIRPDNSFPSFVNNRSGDGWQK
ncbi:TIR domain-containing protein [Maridesulfovibrio sp. FT414]|uniref:TIR domain-containing protein n=1 Tax=Maridesulfovibrio sp. FT414 TaxID=2979469 RepID=UPI003D802919